MISNQHPYLIFLAGQFPRSIQYHIIMIFISAIRNIHKVIPPLPAANFDIFESVFCIFNGYFRFTVYFHLPAHKEACHKSRNSERCLSCRCHFIFSTFYTTGNVAAGKYSAPVRLVFLSWSRAASIASVLVLFAIQTLSC